MANAASFNCAECSHRFCGEGIPNSNGKAPYVKWRIKGVGDFDSCLLPMITEQSNFLIKLHQHYQKGILMQAGGLLDQPNKYLEAMELIG